MHNPLPSQSQFKFAKFMRTKPLVFEESSQIVDTCNAISRIQPENADTNVNSSGQLPIPRIVDPSMVQFLVAHSQFMNAMTQNVNNMMSQQNHTTATLINLLK